MSKQFKLCGKRFEVLLPHHPKEKYKTQTSLENSNCCGHGYIHIYGEIYFT